MDTIEILMEIKSELSEMHSKVDNLREVAHASPCQATVEHIVKMNTAWKTLKILAVAFAGMVSAACAVYAIIK